MTTMMPLAVPSDELYKAANMLRELARIRTAWDADDVDATAELISRVDSSEALETSLVLAAFAMMNRRVAE